MPDFLSPALEPGDVFAGEQPTLTGDGVVLRPWRADDAPALLSAYADPDVQRWHGRTLSAEEAAGWAALRARQWRDQEGIDWAVAEAGGADEALGRIGIRRFEFEEAVGEVVYWARPQARGRRLIARALAVLCEWAFTTAGLYRLELVHSAGNPASCRVAERAGFLHEGTERRSVRHADGRHDMHLHARLADDPSPGAAAE